MSRALPWLLTLVAVSAGALAAWAGARPTGGGDGSREAGRMLDPACAEGATRERCARCHEGSVPLYHSQGFVAREHGAAARVEAATCLGCHERRQCDDCHVERAPEWHSAAFRDPDRGPAARREHAAAALPRRRACMECHAQRFLSQCARCHHPDELPAPHALPLPPPGGAQEAR